MRYEDIPAPLDVAVVARLLGVHRSTVTKIPAAELPFFLTPGGYRRFRPDDVEAYIAARSFGPGRPSAGELPGELPGQTTVDEHLDTHEATA